MWVPPYWAGRGKADDVFSEWHKQMLSLSQRDNVLVKLGALPIHMLSFEGDRSMPPSSIEVAKAWRPWLHSSIGMFGARRCMFESNSSCAEALVQLSGLLERV